MIFPLIPSATVGPLCTQSLHPGRPALTSMLIPCAPIGYVSYIVIDRLFLREGGKVLREALLTHMVGVYLLMSASYTSVFFFPL